MLDFWSLDKLHNWEQNPRSVTKEGLERLKKQLQKHGQYKPLIITKDGTVLGGNMRLRAMREMEIKEAWVSVVEAETEEQKIEIALSDNDRVGRYSGDDLADMVGNLPNVDWKDYAVDLNEPTNMGELIERYSEVIEDEAPDVEDNPISQIGEVYQLGQHRLMCGDSTSPNDVDRLMANHKADMVFTDPPYNIVYEGGMGSDKQHKREMILNDKMTDSEFYAFLYSAISNMMRVTDGIFYICMSSQELPNLKRAFEEAGGHWQSFIIWVKNHFTLSRSDYQNQYELILYGWNKNIKNHFFIDDRTNGNVWMDFGNKAKLVDGDTEITIGGIKIVLEGKVKGKILKGKRKTDIWLYDKPMRSDEHPTMKPVKLCAEAIKNSSLPGQIVLDLFSGSGSTLMACEQTDRVCYGMELDPKYCDVIRKRYYKFIGKEDQWQNQVDPQ
jgi:DNA modification methylase